MIDVDAVKRSVDCRQMVERDLGKPKSRTQDYSTFKCPFHQERKGFSLVVYADYWRCFGKCGMGGDVINWVMRYHRLSFQLACDWLAVGDVPQTGEPVSHPDPGPQPRSEPPDVAWQKVARSIAAEAKERLWGREGTRALHYLTIGRGLSEMIIEAACLGYIPGRSTEWQEIDGLKVPCGIAIPWYADGAIWGIKVRRALGEQRYQQVSGGNLKGCLYLADQIQPGLPLVIAEGEFDALTAWQLGWGKVSVASIGSASNQLINLRWYGKLLAAPQLLVCMDSDKAGERAALEIATLSRAVTRVQVPMGKDMNEFYLRVGQCLSGEWLKKVSEHVS